MKYWIILSAIIATGWCCGFPGAPAHSTVTFNTEITGPNTRATYTCDRGFELLGPALKICSNNGTWIPSGIPFCVLNVAAGKAPMQSSVVNGGIPQKAVDGSTATSFTKDTCTLTDREANPWWYVNLLEPYMVQLVRLDFGKSCCGDKLATIIVRVGNNRPDLGVNPICNRFVGQLEEGRPLFLPCNPPMPGAFVSVHFEGPPGTQLSICEAFVYTDQALPIERCPSFRDQPPGSTSTYNGKCYIFYNRDPKVFDDALEFCTSREGSLLDETNPALQGFLSWELWRRHRGDPNGQYWLGAVRDHEDPNNWKWINGRDVTVSFWNLPGGNENCARFDGTKGWLWSDTNCLAKLNFICQHRPQTCGKPEQPPNSVMLSEDYSVGQLVEYECNVGHVLEGPQTRTCLNSGFFDQFPPTCRYIECGLPAFIQYGRYDLINGTRYHKSIVKYSCDDGYRLVGRSELICDVDQRWNGPPPRCEKITCGPPPFLAHGTSDIPSSVTKVFLGQMISFRCESGFILIGSPSITCNLNGFSSQIPVCEVDRAMKPDLADIHGGQVDQTFSYETNQIDRSDNDVQGSNPILTEVRPPDGGGFEKDEGPIIKPPGYEEKSFGGDDAGPKLHTGGMIALGVFGGFVILAAVITTVVILVRRTQNPPSKKYMRRHDDGGTTSSDSSSNDGHGLNKFYKRAWENLREGGSPLPRDLEKSSAASGGGGVGGVGGGVNNGHQRLSRTETLDNPDFRSTRSLGQEGLRDGSEMTVNDVAAMYTRPEKRRHHHHHHGHRHKSHERDHENERDQQHNDRDQQHNDRDQQHNDRDQQHNDRHVDRDRHDRDWRDRDRRKY